MNLFNQLTSIQDSYITGYQSRQKEIEREERIMIEDMYAQEQAEEEAMRDYNYLDGDVFDLESRDI